MCHPPQSLAGRTGFFSCAMKLNVSCSWMHTNCTPNWAQPEMPPLNSWHALMMKTFRPPEEPIFNKFWMLSEAGCQVKYSHWHFRTMTHGLTSFLVFSGRATLSLDAHSLAKYSRRTYWTRGGYLLAGTRYKLFNVSAERVAYLENQLRWLCVIAFHPRFEWLAGICGDMHGCGRYHAKNVVPSRGMDRWTIQTKMSKRFEHVALLSGFWSGIQRADSQALVLGTRQGTGVSESYSCRPKGIWRGIQTRLVRAARRALTKPQLEAFGRQAEDKGKSLVKLVRDVLLKAWKQQSNIPGASSRSSATAGGWLQYKENGPPFQASELF